MTFDFATVVNFIALGGAFGGICAYLTFTIHSADGGFKPKSDHTFVWWLACISSNAVIGICGATAIQILVLGMRFYEKANAAQVSDFVFLAAISVVGGFGARSFLPRLTEMFERQIARIEEKTDNAIGAATAAVDEVKQVKEDVKAQFQAQDERTKLIAQLESSVHDAASVDTLKFAVDLARRELSKNPLDASFVLPLGRALRRLDLLKEAINELATYIKGRGNVSGPDKDLCYAFYNRACYYSLLNERQPQASYLNFAISDLERSIQYSDEPEIDKNYARNDDDLKSLRSSSRYKSIFEAAPVSPVGAEASE